MHRSMRIAAVLLASALLWCSFHLQTAAATSPAAAKAFQKSKVAAPPDDPLEDLTDAEIDALLSRIIDARIRKVVNQQAAPGPVAAESPGPKRRIMVRMFLKAEDYISYLHDLLDAFIDEASDSSQEFPQAASRLTGGRGAAAIFQMAIGVILLILSGVLAEWLMRRWTADIRRTLLNIPPSGYIRNVWRAILNLSLDILGALVYLLSTFILFTIFFEKEGTTYLFTVCFLIGSYYVRFIILVVTLIFSPQSPLLRFFPVSDAGAHYLFRWTVFISVTAIFLGATSSLLHLAFPAFHLHLVLDNLAGLSMVVLAAVMVVQRRRQVADAIRAQYYSPDREPSPLQEKLTTLWYVPVLLYLFAIAVSWEIGILSGAEDMVNRLILSFLSIPAFMVLDYWCQQLFRITFERLGRTIDLNEPPEELDGDPGEPPKAAPIPSEESMVIGRYIPLIQKGFHVLLGALLLFLLLRLWGIDWPFGREVTRALFSILVVLLLGYVAWEFAKAYIDRKIKEETPEGMEQEEEGGAGGSRSGTLLLLLRKFILTVLVVFVGLTILSSLGVNIGPLIAGAGIFGLAIGFGAQTLVKDIISGIFFLIDDAFRIGDYVESGSMKGKVEQISLRSMRLRHPRGMIHTIPFGDLSSVTNFSRDYIIDKLSFRVRYDTDVDKVRKIIKKINKKVSKDPVMGPSLLSKIKSQGVRALDDSAMVMRVKFKCIPGEQFLIRREVYRLLQEKFHEAGIEFAHRNVTVYFPPEVTQNGAAPEGIDPKLAQAGAAAAMKMIQDEEEALARKAAEESEKKG